MPLFKKERKKTKPVKKAVKINLSLSLSKELEKHQIKMPEDMKHAIWRSLKANHTIKFPLGEELTLNRRLIQKAFNEYEEQRGHLPEEWEKFSKSLKENNISLDEV